MAFDEELGELWFLAVQNVPAALRQHPPLRRAFSGSVTVAAWRAASKHVGSVDGAGRTADEDELPSAEETAAAALKHAGLL
jgi:hypothetical protein